jgi:hypothetical protein
MNGLVLIVAASLLSVGLAADADLSFLIIVGLIFVVSLYIQAIDL